ncbi:MAG: glycosyltransferase [gamma proteobacterium symbiont of Taylorina sp.]|nr:glycosyltransferase [gamma proteobacterium symbiont of Taylorina sp.]
MKVAIVHYWLVGMRGGEKVLEALLDIYPQADVYSHLVDHALISKKISQRVKACTFIQQLPWARRLYQSYLPLMPYALEELDLSDYDLVLSSESGPAKGVITSPDCLHICYCHSPMRYAWDMYHQYKKSAGILKKLLMPWLMHRIRLWDLASSFRVDFFIANSHFVQKRIKKIYRRNSQVIFPPVNTHDFVISNEIGDYYLMVGQLVAYKNTLLAIEAFNINKKKLIIIGHGAELKMLQKKAHENIIFLGTQPFTEIKKYYSQCKALIFPGIEDFGLVPVEAMASGRPVIAYKKGGVLDTIENKVSGVFFEHANVEALNNAINWYEDHTDHFDSIKIKQHSEQFDSSIFKQQITQFISKKLLLNP